MANRGSFKNNLTTYDFEFDEGLESKVRAKLVVEIIKYLLYQRQQLPMVLDQLKRHISITTDTETVMYYCTDNLSVDLFICSIVWIIWRFSEFWDIFIFLLDKEFFLFRIMIQNIYSSACQIRAFLSKNQSYHFTRTKHILWYFCRMKSHIPMYQRVRTSVHWRNMYIMFIQYFFFTTCQLSK